MTARSQRTARKQGGELGGCTEFANRARRKYGAGGNPNEGMKGIPTRVDAWNFVGDELDAIHEASGSENQRVAQNHEIGRKHDIARGPQHAEH